jgi:DNA-directed RNA polymerase specialized sigma24 family protein
VVAKGRKTSKAREERRTTELVSADEKIARLLGILATKDIAQIGERVTLLRAVGFSVPEVAGILGMTENNVRVASHHGRNKRRGRKASRAKKN